jgi:hypothetical protein
MNEHLNKLIDLIRDRKLAKKPKKAIDVDK